MNTLIFAHDDNFGIGINNKLPWRIPQDMKWFKAHTLHKTVVMGRKTFESLGSKPLPERHNVVLSSTLEETPGIKVIRHLDELVASDNNMFIGGAQLYEHVLENLLVDQVIVTHVHGVYDTDTKINYSLDSYKLDEQHVTDEATYSIYYNTFSNQTGRKTNAQRKLGTEVCAVDKISILQFYEFLERNGAVTGYGYGSRYRFIVQECTHMTGGYDPSIAKYEPDFFAALRDGKMDGVAVGYCSSPTTYRIRQFFPAEVFNYRYMHRDVLRALEQRAISVGATTIWTRVPTTERIMYQDNGYETYSVTEDGTLTLFKSLTN